MVKIQTIIEGNKRIEGYILLFSIGLLKGLEKGVIEISTAEKYLFNPYSINKLQTANVDKRILEAVEGCLELDDINDLLPDEYPLTLNELNNEFLELLSEIPYKTFKVGKLIDEVILDCGMLDKGNQDSSHELANGSPLEIDFKRVSRKYSVETLERFKKSKSPFYKIG